MGKLKNIIIPLILLAALIVGYILLSNSKNGLKKENKNPGTVQSIAVLPFTNMSNDSSQEYFSDGLADGILTSLAQLKDLKVCARASSFQFRGKDIDIKEAGKRLGVSTILKGSYIRQGDHVQITAELINVADGSILFSEPYEENMDNIFLLQNKITGAIEKKLKIGLLENEALTSNKKHLPNKEVYDLYLKGRSYWNLKTPPDLKQGINFFEQAIKLDPTYAEAYSGIADCYNALGYLSALAPKEAFPKALEAATKAMELDSTLAEPHAAIGFYKFYHEWDWAAAEQEFRIALALNPNYEMGYDWYGYYLTSMERFDEARIILEKAKELDPLSVQISTDMGFSVYYSSDYDLAIKKLEAALQMNPRFPLAHIWLGRSYQAKKMYPEAIDEYKKALEVLGNVSVPLAQIGNVYGVSGNKIEAQKVLDILTSLSANKFVTSYGVALVYMGVGEKDKTFQWLNKAYDERSQWLVWLKGDPRWIPIHSDKRYIELVNKVGLPR